jgi:hypothetical protein
MQITTTARRIHPVATVCALALTGATAWAVLTPATVKGTHATNTPAPSAVDYERMAAAYRPAGRGGRASAAVINELGPRERRYVQGILRLTPEQVAAGFGQGRR